MQLERRGAVLSSKRKECVRLLPLGACFFYK
jgi:hypothetical protein